jgi:hypothetical protein
MATEPQSTAPELTFSDVAAKFEKLAALLHQSIELKEAQPGQQEALSRLRSAEAAALRGARIASNANS